MLIYYYDLDRLGVHAGTRGERNLYRCVFGKGFFADEAYFGHAICFSLAPLRQKGETSLNCKNVNGLDSIVLKELEVHHPNSLNIVYKAPDLFQALGDRSADVLNSGDLWRASFNVKFSDHKTPRVLNLRPPAAASYMRDSDRLTIEEWMRDKKFLVVSSKDGKDGISVGGA